MDLITHANEVVTIEASQLDRIEEALVELLTFKRKMEAAMTELANSPMAKMAGLSIPGF